MRWNTNKLSDLKYKYTEELNKIYTERESENIINILIQYLFGVSKVDQLLNPDLRLSESELLKLHFAIKELKQFKPIQYITGETEFLNILIGVNESVLIPRPETEELVNLVLDREKDPGLKVLDIGTGSGCIAIVLKKNLDRATVYGSDTSTEALNLAKKNAERNEARIQFMQHDILINREFPMELDIIISNPPYVTSADKSSMHENVLRYEPHRALFVEEDDPLLFYRAIQQFAKGNLKTGGRIYLEINERYGQEVIELFDIPEFATVELHKDIHGKDRFVTIRK